MHDMWENLPPRKKSRVRSPLKISLTKSLTLIHHFTRFCSNRSVYAWTYAPMQPHKIDHESIRIHPPWTPLIHHCWSSSLISNLSFNQNHDPTPPQKIPPSICWTWEILPPILPLKLPWPRKGDSLPREKTLPWECGVCVFFSFFLVGKTTSNKLSNSFFFGKNVQQDQLLGCPPFWVSLFWLQLKEKQQKNNTWDIQLFF